MTSVMSVILDMVTKHPIESASAAYAILAAGLWFISAMVRIPKTFPSGAHVLADPALGQVLVRQSWWSALAALSASLAAFLQVIAMVLG
jgi:hypothetical protein